MMLRPSIAKLYVVNFLVECCGFIAELFLSFALWCLLLPFSPKSFPCTFWVLSQPGMQKLGESQLEVHACDSLHLSMHVFCLLKQLQHRYMCK